jgi:hypothetical protein
MSRAGKLWSKEEVESMLNYVKDGVNIEGIAISHERSVKSIECKLKCIATDMLSNNHSYEEIEKLTRLTRDEINDAVEWRKNQQENQKQRAVKTAKTNKKQIIIDLLKDVQEIQRKLMVLLEAD